MKHYPMLTVNTAAMTRNARRVCAVWAERGVQVAGVVKFSDCAPEIVRAYLAGGCAQIAVSRAVHLPQIKNAPPGPRPCCCGLRCGTKWSWRHSTAT